MSNFYVDKIIKENSIVDFLAERGISPVRSSNNRFFYKCPVHKGDVVPSFIVYGAGTKGRDYQTYHCFGCGSGINIINLKVDLDQTSKKEAISYFLKNSEIDIDNNSVIDDAIENAIKQNEFQREENEMNSLLLLIGYRCREFLKDINDDEYNSIFEKFFKEIDYLVRNANPDMIKKYYELLFEKRIFERIKDKVEKTREDEQTHASEWIL